MTFIFEVSKDGGTEDVAIVSNNLQDAKSELSVFGIFFGGLNFKLKEIPGLNDAGLFYYSEASA